MATRSLPCLWLPRLRSLSNSGRTVRLTISASKPISPVYRQTPIFKDLFQVNWPRRASTHGRAKVELGLVRRKTGADKRADIAKRDADREAAREMSESRRRYSGTEH